MTHRWVRRTSLAAILACGSVGLTGCGDDSSATPSSVSPDPEPSAPATVGSRPTASADRVGAPLVEPARPAAMDTHDEAGARAAAEYLIELSGYAIRSQDISEFREICDSDSTFCSAVIEEVTADTAAGNYTLGGEASLTVSAVAPPDGHSYYTVWGVVDREPFTAYDASGKVIAEPEDEPPTDYAIAVQSEPDGSWVFLSVQAGVVRSP